MKQPLVSIILCTYNGEQFVKEQIDSLLAQTYPSIEIFIIDDASTDNTKEILNKYKHIPQIQIHLREKNHGLGANIEYGLNNVKGDYIAFCDQDDIWLPDKIKQMVNNIKDHLLLYSDSMLIDDKGNDLHKQLSRLRKMYTGQETEGFVFSNVAWGHAILIHKDLIKLITPIPAYIPHDIWMAFKAATVRGIYYFDAVLTRYRQHSTTLTKTIAVKAATRPLSKRFIDYQAKLYWIGIMRDHETRQEKKNFYNRLYQLYERKNTGVYQWQLLFFLLGHRKKLFLFTRKKFFSQLIELIKQSRGEKA